MSHPSSCSSLIPAYNAWKESLSVLKDKKEVFQRENTEESRIELERAMGDVMSTKESFLSLSQTPSLYKNNPCTALEVLALETMERMIGKSSRVESQDGRIVTYNANDSQHPRLTEAISFLPMLDKLQELHCFNTNIKELPKLPDGLQELYCSDTNIKELPKLPDGLQRLYCYKTNIKELPKLPDGLQWLYCYKTNIEELPKLPDGLQELNCSNTNIEEFPKLPDGLRWLDCSYTPASKNPTVRQELEEFNRTHPNAIIRFSP